MADIAIKVDAVSKSFKLPHEKQSSIKGLFVNIFRRKRSFERQEVLKNISFEIKTGEFFGIVGRNGSGKSTLLKLLAGIYSPDKGAIHVNGKLIPFIELGVGFSPELTGRDNVFLNGSLLGFSRKEMEAMYDEIVAFAELERFMDQKLKNYSSGMQVRLAFSIAIRAKGDILLLDEVLAVGDAVFQKKCYDYFKQLKKEKKTVVFVSHDSSALLEYCDNGILLEKGKIVQSGKIDNVVNEYLDIIYKQEEETANNEEKAEGKRWGSGQIKITSVTTSSADANKQKKIFTEDDKNIVITVSYKAEQSIDKPIFGITILDAGGQRVFTSNTKWSKITTHALRKDQVVKATWTVPNAFNTGTFTVSPAVADATGSNTYDWLDDASQFKVRKTIHSIAYINPEHEIAIS